MHRIFVLERISTSIQTGTIDQINQIFMGTPWIFLLINKIFTPNCSQRQPHHRLPLRQSSGKHSMREDMSVKRTKQTDIYVELTGR